MDGGPFRSSRPTSRGSVAEARERGYREPEPVPSPREELAEEPPRASQPPQRPKKTPKRPRERGRPSLWVVIASIVVVLVLSWFAWTKLQDGRTAIDSNRYQAVFFTNGQVYFGKLESFTSEAMRLTDVYYLQAEEADEETDPENPQGAAASEGNMQLIKLGDEIHGPEDEMIILRNQILFYENLRPDGRVAQSISEYRERQ